MKHYAGLDLSMESTAIWVVDSEGRKIHFETVRSEPRAIADVLDRVGPVDRAAIDDADRFTRSRTAGAYFGLVPRRYQSGELEWTGRITKQGDAMVRKLLYEAANSILARSKKSFALKSWALKIARRRGLRKARVALARRFAVVMHAMLRDGALFQT